MKRKEVIQILGVGLLMVSAFAYNIEQIVKLFTSGGRWWVSLIYVAVCIPLQIAALTTINKKEKKK